MEIAHADKAEDDGADTEEFDLVIALNSTGEIIGDEAMKFND